MPSAGWSGRSSSPIKRDIYGAQVPVAERYFEAAAELDVAARRGAPRLLPRRGGGRARGRIGWPATGSGSERPIVAMAPGAAHATKRWPAEYWVDLVRRITPTGADVAVLGGPDDAELGGQIAAARRGPTSRAWPARWASRRPGP